MEPTRMCGSCMPTPESFSGRPPSQVTLIGERRVTSVDPHVRTCMRENASQYRPLNHKTSPAAILSINIRNSRSHFRAHLDYKRRLKCCHHLEVGETAGGQNTGAEGRRRQNGSLPETELFHVPCVPYRTAYLERLPRFEPNLTEDCTPFAHCAYQT